MIHFVQIKYWGNGKLANWEIGKIGKWRNEKWEDTLITPRFAGQIEV
jgi:hypothetical protein